MMDKVTQANAGNAEETAAASQALEAQALVLSDAVASLQKIMDGTGGNFRVHQAVRSLVLDPERSVPPVQCLSSSRLAGSPATAATNGCGTVIPSTKSGRAPVGGRAISAGPRAQSATV